MDAEPKITLDALYVTEDYYDIDRDMLVIYATFRDESADRLWYSEEAPASKPDSYREGFLDRAQAAIADRMT